MNSDEINELIKLALPDAEVDSSDLTGSGNHFQVKVRSSAFSGISLIEQHRLVKDALQSAYDDGRLHALSIKTLT